MEGSGVDRGAGLTSAFGTGAGRHHYVEAHKWFNLVASRGEVAALHERDALAAKMTPLQIAAAPPGLKCPDVGAAETEVTLAPTPHASRQLPNAAAACSPSPGCHSHRPASSTVH